MIKSELGFFELDRFLVSSLTIGLAVVSFSHSAEWLKLTTAKPIVREETKNLSNSKKPNSDLINKFIQENPKLKPSKSIVKYDNKENLSSQITYTSEALMTETLAKVYLQQNNYQKALHAALFDNCFAVSKL